IPSCRIVAARSSSSSGRKTYQESPTRICNSSFDSDLELDYHAARLTKQVGLEVENKLIPESGAGRHRSAHERSGFSCWPPQTRFCFGRYRDGTVTQRTRTTDRLSVAALGRSALAVTRPDGGPLLSAGTSRPRPPCGSLVRGLCRR